MALCIRDSCTRAVVGCDCYAAATLPAGSGKDRARKKIDGRWQMADSEWDEFLANLARLGGLAVDFGVESRCRSDYES